MEIRTMAKLRAWGNSVGVVLPKEELQKANLQIGDEVELSIKQQVDPIEEVFGKLKFKKSTAQLLKEVRRDLKSKFD